MTIKKIHSLTYFLVLVLAATLGCRATSFLINEPTPPEIAPTNAPIVEVTLDEVEQSPTINAQQPTGETGAITFENPDYGFQFDYPPTWTLTEADHSITLAKGPVNLLIHYRWLNEEDIVFRSGMGAGDINYIGKFIFMGQTLPIQALVFEGNTKAVFFSDTGSIEVDNLVFIISLEDLETNYTDVQLNPEIINEATEILSSFR